MQFLRSKNNLIALFLSVLFSPTYGQFDLQRYDNIPVVIDGDQLLNPWVGGLNFCQFSNIDLDQDGTQDLFIFDRSGNGGKKVITYIQNGSSGQSEFIHTTEFDDVYPFKELHDWALLIDFDCDGKADIFSYSVGGIRVFKNTSNTSDGLQFELFTDLIYSNYDPSVANLFVTSVDLPALVDIDNDGDIDVLTFSIFGSYVEYHKNMSIENYGTCDSLDFMVKNRCWGYFSENISTNSVNLLDSCGFNVSNPELTEVILKYTMELKKARQNTVSIDQFLGRKQKHSGSSLLSFDADGNGVKELVLGDVSFDNLVMLHNGGTVDAGVMFGQDSVFPNYDIAADMTIFPGAFFVDVDNDQKRDLLVSPNGKNLSRNFESIWRYNNVGTDNFPDFEHQESNFLQNEMIDVGEGAQPVFFDQNGDGLTDLFVSNYGYFQDGGNYPGKVAYFENTGTAQDPQFELVTRDFLDLSSLGLGQAMRLTFGDMDNDGDKDLFIGEVQGKIHYFENVSTGQGAMFQLTTPNFPDFNGDVIDVGQFATPQIFDVNRDQKPDLLIGERNGNINYYENVGSLNNPSFQLINDSLGGVVVSEWWNITGYASPVMFENTDGEYEMFVGSEVGYIWHFNDIDNNLNGTFNLVDSISQGIYEGTRSHMDLADLDNDGIIDAVVGNYRGGVAFFKNYSVGLNENIGPVRLNVFPNPASDLLTVDFLELGPGSVQVELLDVLGKQIIVRTASPRGKFELNISNIPAGYYTLIFRSDNRTAIASFIKE